MSHSRGLAVIAMVFLAALLGGCASPVVTHPTAIAQLPPAHAGDYHLGAGDEIEVRFFFNPELNDRMTIRPDGKVSVMLLDQDVEVAGKTPQEVAHELKERFAGKITRPELSVAVRSFASQEVFVGGEVTRPGVLTLTTHKTVAQALAEAGWILPTGDPDEVVLVRNGSGDGGKGATDVVPLNVRKILSGEDASGNIQLAAGDILVVPPSGIASFDRGVDQYVRQAMPWSTSLTFGTWVAQP